MHFKRIIMKEMKFIFIVQACFFLAHSAVAQFRTGAEQTAAYVGYLQGNRVGMLVNNSSKIGKVCTVDSLISLGVNIIKVFGPEHGFRADVGAGVQVSHDTDPKTGVKIVSLYGKTKKPTKEMLVDVDLLIYDIQDIGVRYFTYIATMHRVMEACAEQDKELLILERPNPNGQFVDGPILDTNYQADIGMHPVPITRGMTVGEYAQMINGEGWLANGVQCKIKVIKMLHYTHEMPYLPPVKMSPNINTQQAILLYPSTCLFEGTILNEGRGTQYPFTVIGSPALKGMYSFSFTPFSIKEMSGKPIYKDQVCYGLDLRKVDLQKLRAEKKVDLSWLIETYNTYPKKEIFFDKKRSKEAASCTTPLSTAFMIGFVCSCAQVGVITTPPESSSRK